MADRGRRETRGATSTGRTVSPAAKKRAKTSLASHSPVKLVALPFSEFAPRASLLDDLKTLSSMWFGKIHGETHQDRLESFYKNQAELYDGYRARMLHARTPMMTRLFVQPERKGEVVMVDLGGGTGANIEFLDAAIKEGWFRKIVVLDLAPSLCAVARRRANEKWPGVVSVVCGDACNQKERGLPKAGTCDVVTISYALVMIPDWKAAVCLCVCHCVKESSVCALVQVLVQERGRGEVSETEIEGDSERERERERERKRERERERQRERELHGSFIQEGNRAPMSKATHARNWGGTPFYRA